MNYDDIAYELGLISWYEYLDSNQERLDNYETNEVALRAEWESMVEEHRESSVGTFDFGDIGEEIEEYADEDEDEYIVDEEYTSPDDWDDYDYDA